MARASLRPTLKQVAHLAEVSLTTASMALSGRTRNAHLSPGCIARVRAVAERIGYVVNYHAQTLRTGRSHTLGMSVPALGFGTLGHHYWGMITGGAETMARTRGYDALMIGGATSEEPPARCHELLRTGRIDGVVVFRSLFQVLPEALLASRAVVVLVQSPDYHGQPRVMFDDIASSRLIAGHLHGLGHRSVAWLGRRSSRHQALMSRAEAFVAHAGMLGIQVRFLDIPELPDEIQALGYSQRAYEAYLMNATLPEGVTAMACMNDVLALALMRVLASRGIQVPDQVSVIGFDNLYPNLAHPGLTTVDHRLHEIGKRSAALAIDLIEQEGPIDRTHIEMVQPELVVGASSARAPAVMARIGGPDGGIHIASTEL